MCGIIVGIGSGITKKIIRDGLLATESRGKDATGVYQPQYGTFKKGVSASEFVKDPIFNSVKKDKMFLGHCRKWTHGEPKDNNNNHPHQGDKYILIFYNKSFHF